MELLQTSLASEDSSSKRQISAHPWLGFYGLEGSGQSHMCARKPEAHSRATLHGKTKLLKRSFAHAGAKVPCSQGVWRDNSQPKHLNNSAKIHSFDAQQYQKHECFLTNSVGFIALLFFPSVSILCIPYQQCLLARMTFQNPRRTGEHIGVLSNS